MKNIYTIPIYEYHVTDVYYDVNQNKYVYNRESEYIKTIEVFYNIFNVLITTDKKIPIFLEYELDDLIQDYFRNHPDLKKIDIPYGNTIELEKTDKQLTKKRLR